MSNDRGVLYVALGLPYIALANDSVKSLKAKNDIVACLATSSDTPSALIASEFDSVIEVDEAEPHLAKAMAIATSPFKHTIFIDADTYICKSIVDAFDVLSSVHIAGVQQPAYEKQADIPITFPEINTGFLTYARCDEVSAMFEDWAATIKSSKRKVVRDQWAFRKVLYTHKDVRFACLPKEFNFELGNINMAVNGVRVLHGTGFDFAAVAKALNVRGSQRLWFPQEKRILDSREFWKVAAERFERESWTI